MSSSLTPSHENSLNPSEYKRTSTRNLDPDKLRSRTVILGKITKEPVRSEKWYLNPYFPPYTFLSELFLVNRVTRLSKNIITKVNKN